MAVKPAKYPAVQKNEMCCSGSDKCDRDLECFGEGDTAICRQCGEEEDDPCCTAGSQCTGEGLVCDTDSSTCQPCGSGGEICCTERSCDEDGFTCEGSDPGLCRGTCGSGDQPCCIDNNGDENCGNELVCANVQNERICKPCGENTQRCCGSGDKCGWNLGCFGRGSGATCQPCGRGGEQCCSSDKSYQCLSSFVCRSGTCTAEAEPSAVPPAVPPAVVTQPSCADHRASGRVSILGVHQAGQTLTADTYNIQDEHTVGTLTYQWLRVVGNSESVIGDSQSYKLLSADVGKQIKVRVRFSDDLNCLEELESDLTSDIVAEGTQIHCPNNAATGDITIEGMPQVGQSLKAVTSNIVDSDGAANIMLTYEWYRVEGGNEINLPVTGWIYNLVPNDVGNRLKVEVRFTDDQGCREELVSDLTDPVIAQDNSGTTPGEKSDLIVEILDPPSEFTVPEGNSETSHDITIKVSNQGGDTSDNMLGGASKFNFGLAFDRRSGSDFIDARLLEVFSINSLDRGESEERTSTFTLTSRASAGDYRFFAWVDMGGGGENNVSELDEDEDNNWDSALFTVNSPSACDSPAVCSDTQPCCPGNECSSNQCQQCHEADVSCSSETCCGDLKCVLGFSNRPDSQPVCRTATGFHVCNRTPQVRDEIVSILSARDCTVVTRTQLTSISALHLENKNIASLKEGDFEHLGNLEELHLEGNRLSSLDPEIFDDVFGLFDLSLANNHMDALPEGIFESLILLDNIFLHGNDFNCIPQNAFGLRTPQSDLNVYFDAIGSPQSINDALCEGTGVTGNLPDLSVSFAITYHADGNQVDFLPTITATDVPTPYTGSYHYFTYNFSISDSNSQEIHRSRYSARVDDTNVVQLLTADGVGQYGVNNPIMIDTNNLFTPGEQYTFKVFVDSTHVIQESDEENNEDSVRLTFGTADTTDTTDLTIRFFRVPASVDIGQ